MRQWPVDDVYTVPRETLVGRYFDALDMINDLTTNHGDMSVEAIRSCFSIRPQEAKLVNYLSEGGIRNRWSLFRSFSLKQETDYVNAAGEPKLADIIISSARSKLAPFEIQILNARGQGYYMPPASIKKLKQLVAEHEAKQEDMG